MLKVVIDTNVFVSAIFWEKGNPHKVIALALENKFRVFTSARILAELEKVLTRDFEEPRQIIERQLNLILQYAELIEPTVKVEAVKEDPDDNKILECAISCNADYIVTGDKHLLSIGEYEGVKIISAEKLVSSID